MYRVGLVAVIGCATPGPFAGSDPAIIVEEDLTTGFTVTSVGGRNAETFVLRFAESGIHMPVSLIHNDELIAGGDHAPTETGVGIAVYPIFDAVAATYDGAVPGPQFPNVSSTIAVELAGPAIARVRVHWSVTYLCESEHTASGDTIFTVFPGGRIVQREENLHATDKVVIQLPSGPVPCGITDEANSQQLYLTSFWTFTAATTANRDARDALTNPSGPQIGDSLTAACADWGSHKVGVAWPAATSRLAPNELNAFVFDYETSAPSLSNEPRNMLMELQLSTNGRTCGEVLARLAPPILRLGDLPIVNQLDGIYQDSMTRAQAFSITSPDAAMPGGFAVSVELGELDHVRVTKTPEPGPGWYLAQADRVPGRVILWFRDDLEPGQTIVVEPAE